MKPKLLRLMLLLAIVCVLLTVVSFTTADAAHAAALQSHVSRSPASISRVNCNTTEPAALIYTDWQSISHYDLVCFAGTGSESVNLYNVWEVSTTNYRLTWNWTDCNGGKHYGSTIGPYSSLSGVFMCDITYITISIDV